LKAPLRGLEPLGIFLFFAAQADDFLLAFDEDHRIGSAPQSTAAPFDIGAVFARVMHQKHSSASLATEEVDVGDRAADILGTILIPAHQTPRKRIQYD
jgi:hypothetical protein